jgi:molybdenum cofactor biosynthesis enzyme MoaA
MITGKKDDVKNGVNKMKIDIYSIVAGSRACNARCPYCISKMTPPQGVLLQEPDVNWRNFRKGAMLAKQHGAATAMITGKGEPTLFPEQITKFIDVLSEQEFPLIELQTNGILFREQEKRYASWLRQWYEKGLTTIAVSVAHYDNEKNRQVFLPHKDSYPDLGETVKMLHDVGYSARLSCILAREYVDSVGELENMISFSKKNNVEQLTVRPVNKPEKSRDASAYEWAIEHHIEDKRLDEIIRFLTDNGHPLLNLSHGGTVYDVGGQNICLTNSLTIKSGCDEIRQLIFFPDGHLRYDWQYAGAVLL